MSRLIPNADLHSDYDMEISSTRTSHRKYYLIAIGILAVLTVASSAALIAVLVKNSDRSDSDTITINVLQLNDVYELLPLSSGGGLARVSYFRNQLKAKNPKILTILAGDLFSPSAIGTANVSVNGEPYAKLSGRQMVDVMNILPLDYATFGNHEFDVNANEFASRLNESKFHWISSNVWNTTKLPYNGVDQFRVHTFDGIRLGLIGLTINSKVPSYGIIANTTETIDIVQNLIAQHHKEYDVLIAITHQAIDDDRNLINAVPNISLVIGGHEHENWLFFRGQGNLNSDVSFTRVSKADANGKTVYLHTLSFRKSDRVLTGLTSTLQWIHDGMLEDELCANRSQYWTDLAFDGFRAAGFEPTEQVTVLPVALDGLESSVRNKPTTLTVLLTQSMHLPYPQAQIAVMNAGGIRIDDVLPPGPITQYDVLRILPFGNFIDYVTMTGAVITRLLNTGLTNQGSGGYLQYDGTTWSSSLSAYILNSNQQPLDDNTNYTVAIIDYLLTGQEKNLDWLTPNYPGITLLANETSNQTDTRMAAISQLIINYPPV